MRPQGLACMLSWLSHLSLTLCELQDLNEGDRRLLTMNLIIDKSLTRVEFASGLTIYHKHIASLNRTGRTTGSRGLVNIVVWKYSCIESTDPSELTNGRLSCDVCGHVQRAVCITDHIVVSQCRSLTGDFDIIGSATFRI